MATRGKPTLDSYPQGTRRSRIRTMTGGFMYARARQRTVPPMCLLLAALLLILAAPQPGTAQVLYGSILGDVKDASSASIPGVTVVVTNKNTGLTRQAVTDSAGRFNF